MGPEILLIDSDAAHRETIENPLLAAGYRVDAIAHGDAVAHISREDMSRYSAVLVTLTEEPSSLAASHQMGEYVVHFISQLCPEVLPRVIAMTALEIVSTSVASRCRIVCEPMESDQLLAAVRAS
ncbi:MAG: hypothetical protein WA208_20640 [Thermoanaerobaculia bacterium]